MISLPSGRAVPPSERVQKGLRLSRILRPVHGARQATENAIKTAPGGRLSLSRAFTRYKNMVQSVLCHSKSAGRVVKSFRKSRPERIFKTELLVIACVLSFVAVCIFRHSRLGARSAVPGWMRVPPFPVRCVFRHSRLVGCSEKNGQEASLSVLERIRSVCANGTQNTL